MRYIVMCVCVAFCMTPRVLSACPIPEFVEEVEEVSESTELANIESFGIHAEYLMEAPHSPVSDSLVEYAAVEASAEELDEVAVRAEKRPKKNSFFSRLARAVVKVAVPVASIAIGVSTGGWGWAVPAGLEMLKGFTAHKAAEKFNRAAELMRQIEERY